MTQAKNLATEPREAAGIKRYDLEADVVVVGFGLAGACASLEAVAAGADTLVLERASAGGGTSAMSGGVIYMGGGTPVQKACGFDDDPEQMFKFLMAATGAEPDEAKTRLFCDESVAHYHWFLEQGIPFKHSFYPEPSRESDTDDCLVFTGGEDAWPFNEIARPAPRGHKPMVEAAAGGFLMAHMCKAAEEAGTRTEYDVLAETLVLDHEGRVTGLVARRDGQEITIRARRGVVLTSGGFVLNEEMVARHCPEVAKCSLHLSSGGDDGRGIRMGMGAGGEVMRMGAAECAIPLTPPRRMVRGVLVNRFGQRFINEDAYYGRIGQTSLFSQNGEIYFIHDNDTYELNSYEFKVDFVGETLEELERQMSLPDGALQTTIELYNRHAEAGTDPVFHKGAEFLKPLTSPPFGAIDCSTDKVMYATFTLGGLHTLPGGDVLTPDGVPISGLYAAGRTTSGIAGINYVSGVSLGDASFFGRMAGRSAAANSARGTTAQTR
ncbi:MAG: flavoprotein [Deltaproteobacteria bacterium]|nr:flavoprotein [Deltaproteobacteria bacterium]